MQHRSRSRPITKPAPAGAEPKSFRWNKGELFSGGERSSLCGGSTDSGGHGDPRGFLFRLGRSEDEGNLRWKGHSESHVFASYSFSPPSPISSLFLSEPSLLFQRSRRRRGDRCLCFFFRVLFLFIRSTEFTKSPFVVFEAFDRSHCVPLTCNPSDVTIQQTYLSDKFPKALNKQNSSYSG